MFITVRVKTGAASDSIVMDKDNNLYLVSVRKRPIAGEANKAIVALLADFLNIPKTQLLLKSGSKSKLKRFEY